MTLIKEIFGKEYSFKFGIGFLRKINATVKEKTPSGTQVPVGLRFAIASIEDGDYATLADLLHTANEGTDSRITKTKLEEWMESEEVDIEALREEVFDFLSGSNATGRIAKATLAEIQEQKAAQIRYQQMKDEALQKASMEAERKRQELEKAKA